MNASTFAIALGIGIASGVLGGGIVMIPALVLLLDFTQQQAQGAALAAMIPPIGIFAAYEYYRNGHVNIPVAVCIAAGFLAGSFAGAKFAVNIDPASLKRIFGFVLLAVSIKMIFYK